MLPTSADTLNPVNLRSKTIAEKRTTVPTRITLLNYIVYLNTVNRNVNAWAMISVKCRGLLSFQDRGTAKKSQKIIRFDPYFPFTKISSIFVKGQYGLIWDFLSNIFYEFWSKYNTIWPILSFQGFFISFHQKLVFYFYFKHLLKNMNQWQYRLIHTVLSEKFHQLL